MKTYIIAEAGVNHNGSLEIAKKLIQVAAKAGADAVKFQTFQAKEVISKHAVKASYQVQTTGKEESQLEMVQKLELDLKAHKELVNCCKAEGIQFLSTPFDFPSIDLLVNELGVPCLKIPSGEVTNAPYLLKIALTGLPLIMSTGMCTLEDIEAALGVLAFGMLTDGKNPGLEKFNQAFASLEGKKILSERVTLLHCTTEYPAPFEDVNLRAMETMKKKFQLPVGYSDHTNGISIAIGAVALGATIIEKHFTLDRNMVGTDHRASLEPEELITLVKSIREIEKALGSGFKEPAASELKNMSIARKSLIAVRFVKTGEMLTADNLGVKRPGNGISPFHFWDYLGKKASRDFEEDELIK